MAILDYRNGDFEIEDLIAYLEPKIHFLKTNLEEIGAWLHILQIVGNSALFYLTFDTHWAVFTWK